MKIFFVKCYNNNGLSGNICVHYYYYYYYNTDIICSKSIEYRIEINYNEAFWNATVQMNVLNILLRLLQVFNEHDLNCLFFP